MGGDQLLPKLTELDHDSALAVRMTARRAEIFKTDHLSTLHTFAGAHKLLARCKHEGLTLVIAPSSGAGHLREMLEKTGLDDLVERTTSSSDAEHSKPSPDIIEAALATSGLGSDAALMLGDTPHEIEAASRTR